MFAIKDASKIKEAEELFDFCFLVEIVYHENEQEKQKLIRSAMKKAQELGVLGEFNKKLHEYQEIKDKEDEEKKQKQLSGDCTEFETDSKGNLTKTINNYLIILRNDEHFSSIRFNEMSGRPETGENRWTDSHKSSALHYIERIYGLKSERDLDHALQIIWQERRYHPVREKIKSLKWDGKNRIPFFLQKIMDAESSDYVKECSRLIFHCGISRIFAPGCKVDDIIVLQGEQGNGKSTLTQWLSMNDEWYGRISDIKGNVGMEQVQGKWICEISELLALSGADRQEEAKQYFDRKSDNYRRPYAQFSEDVPRQCIFIGTTNLRQPFKDKTGNRRYYPVWCNIKRGALYENEVSVRHYIEQCWAESYELWLKGEIRPNVKREMIEEVKSMQQNALEDDWRVGVIEEYLKDKAHICIIELWEKALKLPDKPTLRQSREIGIILDSFELWERGKGTRHFTDYKSQKFWQRKTTCTSRQIDENYEEIID